jgi:glycosyltransferase involved in cell wall biosynthesis
LQGFFYVRLGAMPKLSAVIITFNEEPNIARCLQSLTTVVDEIVVVDSGSTDRTELLCKQFNAKFIVHPFAGHIQQKNFALSQASNDWVLCLDADEELSSVLADSIHKVMENNPQTGYTMNRLNNYCGAWIRHGSWYPDRKLRLFNRQEVQWTGVNPHDKAEPVEPKKIFHLKGDLLHYSYKSIQEHINRVDFFSTIAAKAYFEQGKKCRWHHLIIRPAHAFVRDFILRLGFLDGYKGWVIARFASYYTYLKYVKLKDYQRRGTNELS